MQETSEPPIVSSTHPSRHTSIHPSIHPPTDQKPTTTHIHTPQTIHSSSSSPSKSPPSTFPYSSTPSSPSSGASASTWPAPSPSDTPTALGKSGDACLVCVCWLVGCLVVPLSDEPTLLHTHTHTHPTPHKPIPPPTHIHTTTTTATSSSLSPPSAPSRAWRNAGRGPPSLRSRASSPTPRRGAPAWAPPPRHRGSPRRWPPPRAGQRGRAAARRRVGRVGEGRRWGVGVVCPLLGTRPRSIRWEAAEGRAVGGR